MLRVSRRDRHLRALGALTFADQLRDLLGERLRAERRSAEDDLADRLVDNLLKARHMCALLIAAEIDEALQAREEQLVGDPHDLLDARDAHAREANPHARRARLDIVPSPFGDSAGELSDVACIRASVAGGRRAQAALRLFVRFNTSAENSGITRFQLLPRNPGGSGEGALEGAQDADGFAQQGRLKVVRGGRRG